MGSIKRVLLIRYNELYFLNTYYKDIFANMCAEEHLSVCEHLMDSQTNMNNYQRANSIEWLCMASKLLGITDRSVFYMAVGMMDRFYDKLTEPKQFADLHLTTVTSFFLSSKYHMVEPITMWDCTRMLCFNRMTKRHIKRKEIEILKTLCCDIDTPNSFDFLVFYFRMMKIKCQEFVKNLKKPCI